jgi:HTH-type transcriptional regulator / antitoxin HigA
MERGALTMATIANDLPDTFEELSNLLSLRPISGDEHLDDAMELVTRLALLNEPTRGQAEYLETLSLLIERYEAEHVQFEKRSPIELLKYLMEGQKMSASDLGRLLGERSLGPKILSGARELSKAHIRILCEKFKVGPGAFL